MSQGRRKHSPAFKAKVALDAFKGEQSVAEVFYGEPVAYDEELKERRCPDQPAFVSYGETQESHLIVA